jgi:nicotinamide mononucleotide transporter
VTDLLAQISPLEAISVVFAVVYLVLAIRQNPLCWVASFISAALGVIVFAQSQLYMQSALWGFFACMAIYGWLQWTRGTDKQPIRQIRTWPITNHVIAIVAIFIISVVFAQALSLTAQTMPFVDSLVTVASILTTWMVAKKLLENWAYWFVIDCISIYLFVSQGIWLYAGLYVVYLVLVVMGYRQWRIDYLKQLPA